MEFIVENPTSRSLRVWDRECSWGWPTLELEIAPEAGGEVFYLVPKSRRWTRNFPLAIEILPGDRHRFIVPGGPDGEWDGLERALHLRDQTLTVRGWLRIPPSQEATEQGVFVGTVSSPPRISNPPHEWLFFA